MQIVIIIFAGVITLLLLFMGRKTQQYLFYIALFSIVIGQRGVFIGRDTSILPFEVIIILLYFFLFLEMIVNRYRVDHVKLPMFLVIMCIWVLIRGGIGLLMGVHWDAILAWTLPLIISIPTFYVIGRMVRDQMHLKTALDLFLAVAVVMSILAIIEYFLPQVSSLVPGFFTNSYLLTPDGFKRSAFSFWGYPVGAVLVTWGMLIAYNRLLRPGKFFSKVMNLAFLLLGGIAVYISGQRSSWIGVAAGLLLLSLPNKAKGWLGATAIGASTALFPVVFWDRFDTITVIFKTGELADHSIVSRVERWQWALNEIRRDPLFGKGYGHWLTHNIFLELGSKVGLFAAIPFLIFFIQLIVRICRVAFSSTETSDRSSGWLFLAIAITWIVQLNVETTFQTPATSVAFWPLMALAWYLPGLVTGFKNGNNQPKNVEVTK